MRAVLTLTLLLAGALAGCVDSEGPADLPMGLRDAEPTFADVQPASVTGLQFVAQLAFEDGTPFPSGAGIWNFGDFVFGSGLSHGFFIADVSDPEHPVLAFNTTEDSYTGFARDADLIAHPDGHRTLVLATQNAGMHFWDVTDPYHPEFLSDLEVYPAHNLAVVPGTELVLNSQSGGLGNFNEIVDASDPAHPRLANSYGTHGCHDITFFGSFGDEKFRAYCAGIERTEIWDLTHLDVNAARAGIKLVSVVSFDDDPANSPVVGNPAFGSYPIRTLHHLAMVNQDASVLIIGDEQNGGGTPGACYMQDSTTGQSSPFGALWFYDLSDEAAPALLSWISAPLLVPTLTPQAPDPNAVDPTNPTSALNLLKPYTTGVPNCTAHFGTLVPGEEKIVVAWYSAGVLLIDFSDPAAPTVLDQYLPATTNPWDARVSNGYVFTGDIVRGMDVLRLV